MGEGFIFEERTRRVTQRVQVLQRRQQRRRLASPRARRRQRLRKLLLRHWQVGLCATECEPLGRRDAARVAIEMAHLLARIG